MFGLSTSDFKTVMRIILAHSAQLSRVVLFGSRARGNHKTHSDIDLAIDHNNSSILATLRESFDASALPYTVDLIDLALEKNTQLNHFIQTDGVVLFDANTANSGENWMMLALLHEKLSDFTSALASLDEALLKDITAESLFLDGTIQRFEFTYELSWKLMKAYLQYLGIDEANNPRAAFRESLKQGLIADKDSAQWFTMLEKRNLTTHTYHKAMALAVYAGIKETYIYLLHNFENTISPLIMTAIQKHQTGTF